jgi:large subunit ribosomal protein L10
LSLRLVEIRRVFLLYGFCINHSKKEVVLPTQEKVNKVTELKEKLERSSIALTTTYTNMNVNELNELRKRTREAGVEFIVIKNTLMHLAADAAQKPQVKEIVQGPTAIAFGYEEPVDVAKAVQEYITSTRSEMSIQGAVIGDGPALPPSDVIRLASLPPKPQLVAQLLGQMQAPIYGLLNVLNGPLWNFGRLLQARVQQMESSGEAAGAETTEDDSPVAEVAENNTTATETTEDDSPVAEVAEDDSVEAE